MIVGVITSGKNIILEVEPFVYESINGTDNFKFKVSTTIHRKREEERLESITDDVQSIVTLVSTLIQTTLVEEVVNR